MKITYDPAKNAANIIKHGFSLDAFELLETSDSIYITDKRHDYGEERLRMFAKLDGRLCVAVFTIRDETHRVISLRKANKKEREFYETQKK